MAGLKVGVLTSFPLQKASFKGNVRIAWALVGNNTKEKWPYGIHHGNIIALDDSFQHVYLSLFALVAGPHNLCIWLWWLGVMISATH